MYQLELDAIDKIFNKDGFINLVINDTIKKQHLDDERRSLFTKIVYGVVENKIYLDYQISFYLKNPNINNDVYNILRMGCYMIYFLNIKNYHVLDSLVEMTKVKYPNMSGLVNAILRNFTRNPLKEIEKENKLEYLSIKYSYPIKVVTFLNKQYPDSIEDILKPSIDNYNIYRINTLKAEKKDIVSKFSNACYLDDALITKDNLNHTKEFKDGSLVYQDYASQRVAYTSGIKENDTVLDMCSAPGSKAFHVAAITNNKAKITCCDIYEHKAKLIEEQAKKLGVTCIKTKVCDSSLEKYDKPFDVVLLDAPCSGLGVMKHKCDLKYHFEFNKIKEIVTLQKALLGAACLNVKVGGTLIYSTCTINKEENEEMMNYFLKKHKNFEKVLEESYLPSDKHDGFYICKLKKLS